ncbi:MAG: choice-of-anchor D domain-containing protein [Solirubrobacteraceae bacterium]
MLWPVPAERQTEPPEELVEALNEPSSAPEPDKSALDRLADKLSEWTDMIERPTVILGSVVKGKLPPGDVLPDELSDLLGGLLLLVKAGRFAEAIRLGRPLCRVFGLTLRWAGIVETLRLVLHAATALADTGTMAWAEHELGTLYLTVGNANEAREHLNRARDLRKKLGDTEGLAATDHNLALLPRARRVPPFTAALTAIGLLLVIVLVLALARPLGPGTSSSSSTTLTQVSTGFAIVSPSTLGFGLEDVGDSTAPEDVTLMVPARGSVNVAAVSITGSDASDFRLASDSCAARRIGPRGACSVGVSFAPAVMGGLEAALRFSDGGSPKGQEVALSGTGTRGVEVAVNPAELNFGTRAVGRPGVSERVALSNHGGGPVAVSSVKVTGADSSDFSLSSDSCSNGPVTSGGGCSVAVTFTPSEAGPRTATLSFADSASQEAQQVSLSGVGTNAGGLVVSPDVLSFGSVNLAQTGGPQTATVSNRSTGALPIGSVKLTGADAGDFSLASDGCNEQMLAPNGTCTIKVQFAPAAGGALSAMLTISGQASGQAQEMALSGIGVTTVVAQVTSSLSFGNEPYEQTTGAQTVTVSSQGSAPLTVQPATLEGPDAGDFAIASDGCSGETVTPRSSCSISVTFTPKAVGQRTATLAIADNATPSTETAALSGDGTGTPTATASPPTVTLRSARLVNQTPPVVTLNNGGNAPLSVGMVTITGSDASAFQLSQDNCSEQLIAPGDSCTVTIALAPAQTSTAAPAAAAPPPKTYTAQLNFPDNAASSPQVVMIVGYLSSG